MDPSHFTPCYQCANCNSTYNPQWQNCLRVSHEHYQHSETRRTETTHSTFTVTSGNHFTPVNHTETLSNEGLNHFTPVNYTETPSDQRFNPTHSMHLDTHVPSHRTSTTQDGRHPSQGLFTEYNFGPSNNRTDTPSNNGGPNQGSFLHRNVRSPVISTNTSTHGTHPSQRLSTDNSVRTFQTLADALSADQGSNQGHSIPRSIRTPTISTNSLTPDRRLSQGLSTDYGFRTFQTLADALSADKGPNQSHFVHHGIHAPLNYTSNPIDGRRPHRQEYFRNESVPTYESHDDTPSDDDGGPNQGRFVNRSVRTPVNSANIPSNDVRPRQEHFGDPGFRTSKYRTDTPSNDNGPNQGHFTPYSSETQTVPANSSSKPGRFRNSTLSSDHPNFNNKPLERFRIPANVQPTLETFTTSALSTDYTTSSHSYASQIRSPALPQTYPQTDPQTYPHQPVVNNCSPLQEFSQLQVLATEATRLWAANNAGRSAPEASQPPLVEDTKMRHDISRLPAREQIFRSADGYFVDIHRRPLTPRHCTLWNPAKAPHCVHCFTTVEAVSRWKCLGRDADNKYVWLCGRCCK